MEQLRRDGQSEKVENYLLSGLALSTMLRQGMIFLMVLEKMETEHIVQC